MVLFAVNCVDLVTCVPPVAEEYQPKKLKPVRVGVGREDSFEFTVVAEVGETVPPLALKVIVHSAL